MKIPRLLWSLAMFSIAAHAAALEPEAAAVTAEPDGEQGHWSRLPIWGEEARARGYDLPLPFGVGLNAYHEKQPFDVTGLELAIGGGPLVGVDRFAEVDTVDTEQSNFNLRLDTWLFPFLNVYGIAGYTEGRMQGSIFIPRIAAGPITIVPETTLPLDISYDGPTFGGGMTLGGGTRVSTWRDLTVFVVADANFTRTPLDFLDEGLESDTSISAWVTSFRLGLRGRLNENLIAALWGGSMLQFVDQTIEGRVPALDLRFAVQEEAQSPANALVGGRLEIGSHWDLLVEAGFGDRTSILGAVGFRF